METILRFPQLKLKTGLSRSTTYDKINPESPRYDPTFPRPVPLGGRAVGFLQSEVEQWVEGCIKARAKSSDAKQGGNA